MIQLHLASFYAQNTFKKITRENAHWTNYWISIEGVRAPWPYMYSYNWLTSWQNKNLEGKYTSGLLFTAKILQEAMCRTYPYMDQITNN